MPLAIQMGCGFVSDNRGKIKVGHSTGWRLEVECRGGGIMHGSTECMIAKAYLEDAHIEYASAEQYTTVTAEASKSINSPINYKDGGFSAPDPTLTGPRSFLG